MTTVSDVSDFGTIIRETLIYFGETTRTVAPDAPATCGDVSHVV